MTLRPGRADLSEVSMRVIRLLMIAIALSAAAVAQTGLKAGAQDRPSSEPVRVDLPLARFRGRPPAVTMKQALRIAEQYIKRNKIKIEPYYLREAKLIYPGVDNGVKESYWWFWWVAPNGASGDYVEIAVSMDGKARRVPSM